MKKNYNYRKNAVLISAFLLLVSLASLFFLLAPGGKEGGYTADIYQNGVLIRSIPLDDAAQSGIFTIEGEGGCVNEIEVRSGGIAVISADCPDRVCVRQGFVHDSRLPIICLPNRLVIQLRPASEEESEAPDIIAY